MPPSFSLKKLLPLTIASVLLTAGSASAAAPDAPWAGTGTATTTVADNGSTTNEPTLKYDVDGFSGRWAFSAVAKSARKQPVDWVYEGFHSWAGVKVSIERFVVHGGKETVTPLASAGPVWCCTAPSGGFKYSGSTTFDLQSGDTYGFRMVGSHGDIARKLTGALRLRVPDVTPPTISPVITGKLGQNGYYTSDVKVAWNVEELDGGPIKKGGCDDATVTKDTAGTTLTCTAASDGGKSSKSVTIKRDATAPALTVPGTIVKQDAGPDGAALAYDATATDGVDANPALACTPASGAQFPIGTTNVSCTASDAAGNSTAKSFEVIVLRGATPAAAVTNVVQMAAPAAAPARTQINPLLAFRFSTKRGLTRLERLIVKNLPHGSTVTITCKGSSCPKQLKGRTFAQRIPYTSVNLSRLVKGRLKPGTVITVVATSPDGVSATKTVTVRKGKAPRIS